MMDKIIKTKIVRKALLGNKKAKSKCYYNSILLPCPFCGSLYSDYSEQPEIKTDGSFAWVECKHCGAIGPKTEIDIFRGEKPAIRSWNDRPKPPVLRCIDCKHYHIISLWDGYCESVCIRHCSVDFCDRFEPREE